LTKSNIYVTLSKEVGLTMKNTRIRVARIEAGMSQEQLAEAVRVTRQTIGLIETGDYNPSLKLCLAICHALHKTLNDLFWEE
jgi:putative transcriptional regulator